MEIIPCEKKKHVLNKEHKKPDWPWFLRKSMLPPCLTSKKLKYSLLRTVRMMISSLLKKHHCSRTELVTGTIFGHKTEQGHLHLVIQAKPKSPPLFVLELASCTDFFMQTISNGPIQFLLTSVKKDSSMSVWEEWKWTEHVNGQLVGEASRLISETANLEFLGAIEHVTCGTGVIPNYEDKGVMRQLWYIRAEFENIGRSFDSESLSMVRPEDTGCADISIHFSRV